MSSDASIPSEPRVAGRTRLADDLQLVLTKADGRGVTVGEIMEILADRGVAMVLIVSTFPFLIPVPTMGLSAPAGAAVALFGLMLAIGMRPRLPGFLARRQISNAVLERVVNVATRWVTRVETLLRPRLKFMLWPGINIVIGLALAVCGFLMALPLPIPFTNAIPAVVILVLLVGILERDGLVILLGLAMSLVLVVAFGVLAYLLVRYGYDGVMSLFSRSAPAPAAP